MFACKVALRLGFIQSDGLNYAIMKITCQATLTKIISACMIRSMKTKQATKRAGGIRKLAALLDISTTAIYAWGEDVPKLRVFQIEAMLPAKKHRLRTASPKNDS